MNSPITTEIKINDRYGEMCLQDSVAGSSMVGDRKPKGYVEIFDVKPNGDKQLVGKHNLVVYQGREWIAERVFNLDNVSVNTAPAQFINWFGIGSGGTPVGDPLNPITPVSTDSMLTTEVPFNDTDATYADLRESDYYKHPFDAVEFEQDSNNDDSWLIVKVTTTVSTLDSNGYNLNEAGLFVSTSEAGGFAGPFNLFSKVTFPTIVKDSTRQLMFMWYLYF